MPVLIHTLNGQALTLHISRRSKTNIILRPHGPDSLQLSIPPWLRQNALREWLSSHPDLLRDMLGRAPAPAGKPVLPGQIWFHGRRCGWRQDAAGEETTFDREHAVFRLPPGPTDEQVRQLSAFLYREAAGHLLPLLLRHAQSLGLQPAAVRLTRAKTFWGVCRRSSGIRLNWRLIGAPGFVQEYVCIHELCHLPHPDHSPAFWQAVRRRTPHTDEAKSWLAAHGTELFALG